MSLKTQSTPCATITCDSDGCLSWMEFPLASALSVRTRLNMAGWLELPSKEHVCPHCLDLVYSLPGPADVTAPLLVGG
jgi:hypothetical protein